MTVNASPLRETVSQRHVSSVSPGVLETKSLSRLPASADAPEASGPQPQPCTSAEPLKHPHGSLHLELTPLPDSRHCQQPSPAHPARALHTCAPVAASYCWSQSHSILFCISFWCFFFCCHPVTPFA